MQIQELKLINDILDTIKEKIPNLEIQKYIEEHISELLDGNNKIYDLTTGIVIYKTKHDGNFEKYFKLIFYPTNNYFDFKNFSKLSIIYSSDNYIEKKDIIFDNNLIKVTELEHKNIKDFDNVNSKTIQSVSKKIYLNDYLIYNYFSISKINSSFLIPSYEIEEETFINSENSITQSIITVPKYCSINSITNDVKKTNTILGQYIKDHNLENITYITSKHLVGEKFSTASLENEQSEDSLIYTAATSHTYKKMMQQFDKMNIKI